MTPETTPSSSGSDSSRPSLKSADERLMVAVRIRPLKADEPQRVLYAVNKKVSTRGFIRVLIVILKSINESRLDAFCCISIFLHTAVNTTVIIISSTAFIATIFL